MRDAPMNTDWRNGFIFVGNHLVLDFINTRPVINGGAVELLPDGPALARWLEGAGLIDSRESARLVRKWSAPEFTAVLEQLRRFREDLRKAVFQIERGLEIPPSFIREVNRMLLRHPSVDRLVDVDGVIRRRRRLAIEIPEDAFAPLADAAADLLANNERRRIRKCPNCVLHFYDVSKKGTRIWCSMNICGNRSKVAAYAARRHDAKT